MVNGLNLSVKRGILLNWSQNHVPSICCLQEIHFKYKDTAGYKKEKEDGERMP